MQKKKHSKLKILLNPFKILPSKRKENIVIFLVKLQKAFLEDVALQAIQFSGQREKFSFRLNK